MKFLLSARSGDITAWGAAKEFADLFRQSVHDRAASGRNGTAEAVYSGSATALEKAAEIHRSIIAHRNRILATVRTATTPFQLKELATEYYGLLYQHQDVFHSAPSFYKMSMDFLQTVGSTLMTSSRDQLGLYARHLPEMALIALGPAGRGEYSPFCQLQLVLVHGEVEPSQLQTIGLFCHTLHAEIEATGLAIDHAISPRNSEWRGSISEWQQRFEAARHYGMTDGMINLLRLTDQSFLTENMELAHRFKEMTVRTLSENRTAQANLIERMESLSNGLGMMGRLKLERNDPGRGLFRLIDHGLLPLSSALSALALIKGSSAVNSCERILDLLKLRELDVDLAEKMLETWHSLHELLLHSEQQLTLFENTDSSLFLNPAQLTVEERQSLKTALTSVAAIQRHVAITFSGMGE